MNDRNEKCPKFFGKYRGTVVDNEDPDGLGRLIVNVLDVLGEKESGWALPSLPYAGDGVGLYLIPPKDAFVWVEFEHGEPEFPVWSGCFWLSQDKVPDEAEGPKTKVLKTDIGTILINDSSGDSGITIKTTENMEIVINSDGIEIKTAMGASVKLSNNKVSINGNALEVE